MRLQVEQQIGLGGHEVAALVAAIEQTGLLDRAGRRRHDRPVVAGHDGAVVEVARTDQRKVDVEAQVVAFEAERALEDAVADVAHEYLLATLALLDVARLELELKVLDWARVVVAAAVGVGGRRRSTPVRLHRARRCFLAVADSTCPDETTAVNIRRRRATTFCPPTNKRRGFEFYGSFLPLSGLRNVIFFFRRRHFAPSMRIISSRRRGKFPLDCHQNPDISLDPINTLRLAEPPWDRHLWEIPASCRSPLIQSI